MFSQCLVKVIFTLFCVNNVSTSNYDSLCYIYSFNDASLYSNSIISLDGFLAKIDKQVGAKRACPNDSIDSDSEESLVPHTPGHSNISQFKTDKPAQPLLKLGMCFLSIL